MSTDDNELVARANKGDSAAFAALLSRHYALIYRLSYRMLRSKADAEDLTQDICVSLARKIQCFSGSAKFSTWLYQVVLNACRDFLRRRKTIEKIHAEYSEVETMQQAARDAQQKEIRWAYEAIASLPDDLAETALLVVAEGLNHAEVGQILNIKEATVSWRMMQVRKALKALARSQTGL